MTAIANMLPTHSNFVVDTVTVPSEALLLADACTRAGEQEALLSFDSVAFAEIWPADIELFVVTIASSTFCDYHDR